MKKFLKYLFTYSEEREKKQSVVLFPIMVLVMIIYAVSSVISASKPTDFGHRMRVNDSIMEFERQIDKIKRDWEFEKVVLKDNAKYVRSMMEMFSESRERAEEEKSDRRDRIMSEVAELLRKHNERRHGRSNDLNDDHDAKDDHDLEMEIKEKIRSDLLKEN